MTVPLPHAARSAVFWLGGGALFVAFLLLLVKAPGAEVVGSPDVTVESFRVLFMAGFVVVTIDTIVRAFIQDLLAGSEARDGREG